MAKACSRRPAWMRVQDTIERALVSRDERVQCVVIMDRLDTGWLPMEILDARACKTAKAYHSRNRPWQVG